MSIECFIIEVIEGRKKAPLIKGFLCFLSFLFRLVTAVRHFLYKIRLLKTHRLSLPVISIGNLVAGGTGKTPFTAKLIQELSEGSAVLTRGYRSEKKQAPLLVTKDTNVSLAGDEPLLLARETGAAIWVYKDRVESGKQAIQQGAKRILLEDGFQHRRLARDVDVVLLDGLDPWGKGHFLPRGYLRDAPSRLKEANWVVVTRFEEVEDKDGLLQEIQELTSSPVMGFGTNYTLDKVSKGESIGAFCGIAKPLPFYRALEEKGIRLVKTFSSKDHCLPSLEELKEFALACKEQGATYLVCTEKDRVKLPENLQIALPICSLKMELECIWNENFWKEMIQSIKNRK